MAVTTSASAGDVLQLIASGTARTRAAIALRTGLSRSTVTERLDALFGADLIREGVESTAARGRPSKVLALNAESRVVLAADVGEDHLRLALTTLDGAVLGERVGEVQVDIGADRSVAWILRTGQELLAELGRRPEELIGVGLSLPAPVDFAGGTVTGPSVMAGWEGVRLEPLVRRTFDVPVVVENDVNARGLGEYEAHWADAGEVLYVKAGTGIGSAIISAGRLFRGSTGAAGDLGHLRLDPESGPLCRCGSLGCVEAYAAGWSVAQSLAEQGIAVPSTSAVVELVAARVPEAVRAVHRAGQILGRGIAYCVSMLNPDLVIVSGRLGQGNEPLLAGVRESVLQYSLPLAVRDLRIESGRGDERCGVRGVAHLAVQRALEPARVNAHLQAAAR